MSRVAIANLKGPKGETGPQGLPGAEGVPTDAAVAQLVEIPSETKTKLDFAYMRVGTIVVNVKDLGAVGDGVADDSAAIQAALLLGDVVFFPAGIYLVSDELKVPSYTAVTGAGMDAAVVRMKAGTDRALNVFTNASNTRAARFNYDEKIRFADLTIDGNYAARVTTSTPWEGNGCGIMLAAVRDSVIERVKVTDAPLHCFAVDASWLPTETTGGADFYAESPSYNVTIRDCIALDPGVDDGFTTHYSHNILIENCVAEIDEVNDLSGGVQNGFEVDDGSSFVNVRNCYARGWQNGFQVKGHSYAPPAHDIELSACVSVGSGCGFTLSSGSNPIGRNIRVVGCTVKNAAPVGTENNRETAMKIWDYLDVFVRDFTIIDSPFGGILMTVKGVVVLDGIVIRNSGTAASIPDMALIRVTGNSTTDGNLTIRNVVADSQIVAASLIRNNYGESDFKMEVENVTARGTADYPLISDSFFSNDRHFTRIHSVGFAAGVAYRGGSGTPVDTIQGTMPVLMGSRSPEGVVGARVGSLYVRLNGGAGSTLYVKESGSGTSGWAAK